MPGPTTEILNEDVKGLKDSIHKVELDIRELSTQVKGLLTSIKLLAVLVVSTLGASIWWGATLTADVRNLGSKMEEKFAAADKRMEEKFAAADKRMEEKFAAVDKRFDKLEASIASVLEQTKPAAKP